MTQKEMILDYIERNGSITQMQALRELGCLRLASRVCDLRKDGHIIQKEMIPVPRRDGATAFVARYSLGV